MTSLLTILGVVLILVALRDIFQQLFNPSGGGSLSRTLMRSVWGAFRLLASCRPALLSLAGPFVLLSIIASWGSLLAVGWTLILWPQMPENFLYQTGLDPPQNDGFLSALYVSLTTLMPLGYGDIVPTSWFLRVLQPLQALTGFVLLATSLTWLISINQVISRRRTFAYEVHFIREPEPETGNIIEKMSPDAATKLLSDLTLRLAAINMDLNRFPITYYFHERDERSSLSGVLPYLAWLAERAGDEHHAAGIRLRAAPLRSAICFEERLRHRLGKRALLKLTHEAWVNRIFHLRYHRPKLPRGLTAWQAEERAYENKPEGALRVVYCKALGDGAA